MSDSFHSVNRWRRSRGGGRGSGNERYETLDGGLGRGFSRGARGGDRGSRGEDRGAHGGDRGARGGDRGSRGGDRGSRGEDRGARGGDLGSRGGGRGSGNGNGGLGRGFSRGARGARGETGRGGKSRADIKIESFGFRNLQSMAEKDADELVLDMTSERCLLATENLVNDVQHMDDEKVVLVLKVLAKACSCETTRSSLHKLLCKLPKSTFLSLHLSNYINRMAIASDLDVEDKQNQLKSMVKIFKQLLIMLPSSFADLPIPQLHFATVTLNNKGELFDGKILSEVEGLGAMKEEMAEKVKQEEEERSRKPKRRNPRDEAALLDDETPPDNFRDLSVVPTLEDIHIKGKPFYRRNKVDGSYDSTEHYLDVQFRLMREDFVRPLRDGINDLLVKMGSAKIGPLQDIRVYHGIHILFPVFTSKGLTHIIKFDVSKMSRVGWENSKRLIYGSLLCLSKDKFETILLATVENRDLKELKEGRIEIRFTDTSQTVELDHKTTYDMVETTAFFESYRPVLEGLKEIDPDRFPFQRYIVECQQEVQPPAYLRNKSREEVTYDLTPIMKEEPAARIRRRTRQLHARPEHTKRTGKEVRILDMNSWPSAEDLELDASQLKAVQLALTSEFALIQGPPGTGKTYIGLKVVNVLLHNKHEWMTGMEVDDDDDDENLHERLRQPLRRHRAATATSHPILVVCYTNHALDQFLEGIHEFHPEGIVRVGSRSQSEIMKECTLKELRHRMRQNKEAPRKIHQAFCEIKEKLDHISHQMKVATENLQICMVNLVHEKELWEGDHMTKEQFYSLIKANTDSFTGVSSEKSVMCYWLGILAHDPFESSIVEQPIAVFPFNAAATKFNLVNKHHIAKLINLKKAPGMDGNPHSSWELQGARNSYIQIPNCLNGPLDTCQSMTILLFVYPMSPKGGPIVCFKDERSMRIGIQISQDGEVNGKGVLTAVFNRRDGAAMLKPLCKPVLRLNQWNYIGVSYDYDTGIYRLWHDGKMVQELHIVMHERMEISSQYPVFIGSLNSRNSNSFFKGRICHLYIFPQAIRREQILRIAGIREWDLEEEAVDIAEEVDDEETNDDIRYQAGAEQELRMLDMDDDFCDGQKNRLKETLRIADPFEDENNGLPQDQQWQIQNLARYKKKIKKTIKKEISNSDMMSSEEAAQVIDVWQLSKKDRWRLYRHWVDQLCRGYRQTVERFQQAFEQGAERLREVNSLQDQIILKKATVIGMTTTGAARCRDLIQKIKPRITIVEEAAEVLEAHIVTSLSPGCQHLILIGDHQQLRPSPTVYDLAKNYHLDMSLFERMFKNGMKLERLCAQHRMRPEIAEMMEHIYDDLQNHESVKNYERIMGVNNNIFFIKHDELEEYIEEGRSRSNLHEAKYLAALCRYFILQGYKRDQITILTMYTGQLVQLKKEMPRDFFEGVRVCAVDNFQGEENDIILLSLVRSNEEGKIGFLRTSNRVCVALSRAKKGFYCIGNLDLMCEKEDLWRKIIEDMRGKGRVGRHLTLTCQNHPKNVIQASTAEHFRNAPEGGCLEPCNTRLDCGHVCEKLCHPVDSEHEEYKCLQKCTKMMECDTHMCPKLCWEKCIERCRVLVWKEIPECHHQQQVLCYIDPKIFHCGAPCLKKLPCSHPCTKKCWEKCDEKCMEKVPKRCSGGHVNTMQCHVDPGEFSCMEKVPKTWSCGHVNTVECHVDPGKFSCMEKVPKKWSCGHVNTVECHVDPTNTKCTAPCGELLKCDHPCQGNCSDCFQGRVHQQCKAKCDRRLFCGHLCKKACTRNCPPCKEPCKSRCVHSKCTKKCGEPCQPCMMKCAWACQHHKCKQRCGEPCDRPRCNKPCTKKIPKCRHPCIGMCGEPCPKKCRVCHKDKVTEILFGDEDEPNARFVELQGCGHVIEVQAMDHYMDDVGDDASSLQLKGCPRCKTPIRTTLRYGNIIKSMLSDLEKVKAKLIIPDYKLQLESKRLQDKITRHRFPKDMDKILATLCARGLTSDQLNMYENQINFMIFLSRIITRLSKLKLTCKGVWSSVVEEEVFNLKPRIMELKSTFSEQEKEEINEELFRISLLTSYRFLIHQIEKKHIHVDHRDKYTLDHIGEVIESGKRIGKEDRERYGKRMKEISNKYDGLNVSYLSVSKKEKDMIVKAMGMAQGHWFKCPKGHIYCIGDSGSATVESSCPECGSTIGGTSHTLTAGNTLAREMDGAQHAAWSDHTNNMGNFDL